MSSIFGDAPIQALATEQIRLELQKVGATIATTAKLEVYQDPDRFLAEAYDRLVHRLTAYVLADKLVGDTYKTTVDKTVTLDVPVKTPASWFQHFKLQHLPTISKRWPVRYHQDEYLVEHRVMVPVEVTFERYATYPHANEAIPPERFGQPVIFERVVEA